VEPHESKPPTLEYRHTQDPRDARRRRATRVAAPCVVLGLLMFIAQPLLRMFLPAETGDQIGGGLIWVGFVLLITGLCIVFNYIDDYLRWWR
jgi:hypothetical protein